MHSYASFDQYKNSGGLFGERLYTAVVRNGVSVENMLESYNKLRRSGLHTPDARFLPVVAQILTVAKQEGIATPLPELVHEAYLFANKKDPSPPSCGPRSEVL